LSPSPRQKQDPNLFSIFRLRILLLLLETINPSSSIPTHHFTPLAVSGEFQLPLVGDGVVYILLRSAYHGVLRVVGVGFLDGEGGVEGDRGGGDRFGKRRVGWERTVVLRWECIVDYECGGVRRREQEIVAGNGDDEECSGVRDFKG